LLVIAACSSAFAQTSSRARVTRAAFFADGAEAAIKQAAEQLVAAKKPYERDVEVLRRLRSADDALSDTMQPSTAIQKAYEEVGEARRLAPEFVVMQALIAAHQTLEDARKSPGMADFGRLRGVVRDALGPASRVAVRNALRLQDETLAWLKVQQLIAEHLRSLSDIASNTLRAAEQ
jgi:hypothetical protein